MLRRKMEKIVFLDRDGVINRKPPPHQYVVRWEDFHLLPNVIDAIRLLNNADYKVIVVSNQRCVALKQATYSQIEDIHEKANQLLNHYGANIDLFLFCPHDYGQCNCRKPDIGLFLKAERFFDINKKESWMIGDSSTDIAAGTAYGVNTLWIKKHADNVWSFTSLLDAVTFLLAQKNSK